MDLISIPDQGYISGYATVAGKDATVYMDNNGDQLFLTGLSASQLRRLAYACLTLAEDL